MDLDAKCDSTNPDQPLFSPSRIVAATPITKYYSGKSVFVTGGTGFLGTVLIGKLLATCDVKRVYMLIKAKNEESLKKRLAEFINSPVFDEVRKNNIRALDNLVPVLGDIREMKLGLCEEDIATLCAQVQVVFHVAADIRLSSDLKETLDANTSATAELVAISKGMQLLEVFLYVSTAYSHCQRKLIDEKVYEPGASIEAIYDISRNNKRGTILDNQRKYLMENRFNTYSFSKSLAEKIVEEGCFGVPSVIVRPSIVTSSLNFPEPGWTKSWSVQNTLVLAVADGVLRCIPGDFSSLLDIVPVDQVVNMMIASVWDVHKHQTERVKVFNCCSGLQNPVTVDTVMRSGIRLARKHSWTAIFTRILIIVKNRKIFSIIWFLMQTVPALILDILSLWPLLRMAKMNARLMRFLAAVEYFFLVDFTFIDYNVRQLLRDMDPLDQALFDFDFGNIDWELYLESYVCGLRKYLKWK